LDEAVGAMNSDGRFLRILVGGPGFEPGASRSRTVVALGSGRVARGRLVHGVRGFRPLGRYVPVGAAWVATRLGQRSLRPERWAGSAEVRNRTRRSFWTPHHARLVRRVDRDRLWENFL